MLGQRRKQKLKTVKMSHRDRKAETRMTSKDVLASPEEGGQRDNLPAEEGLKTSHT